jgi:hypothetical protein
VRVSVRCEACAVVSVQVDYVHVSAADWRSQ